LTRPRGMFINPIQRVSATALSVDDFDTALVT
jgi:hypothetical protein